MINGLPIQRCTHGALMRMVRNSSELARYYLEKNRQKIANCTEFKDMLAAFAENGKKTDAAFVRGIISGSAANSAPGTISEPGRQSGEIDGANQKPSTTGNAAPIKH